MKRKNLTEAMADALEDVRERQADELLRESMALERARSRIDALISQILSERKEAAAAAIQEGRSPDKALDHVVEGLRALRADIIQRADDTWEEMHRLRERFGPGLQRLANAVIQNAAEDYEKALSGYFQDDAAEMRMIELFADHGAEVYSEVDFGNVLARIKGVYQRSFIPLAQKVYRELLTESRPLYRYKCPLDGGGLYINRDGGRPKVACSTCDLFWTIPEKEAKKK